MNAMPPAHPRPNTPKTTPDKEGPMDFSENTENDPRTDPAAADAATISNDGSKDPGAHAADEVSYREDWQEALRWPFAEAMRGAFSKSSDGGSIIMNSDPTGVGKSYQMGVSAVEEAERALAGGRGGTVFLVAPRNDQRRDILKSIQKRLSTSCAKELIDVVFLRSIADAFAAMAGGDRSDVGPGCPIFTCHGDQVASNLGPKSSTAGKRSAMGGSIEDMKRGLPLMAKLSAEDPAMGAQRQKNAVAKVCDAIHKAAGRGHHLTAGCASCPLMNPASRLFGEETDGRKKVRIALVTTQRLLFGFSGFDVVGEPGEGRVERRRHVFFGSAGSEKLRQIQGCALIIDESVDAFKIAWAHIWAHSRIEYGITALAVTLHGIRDYGARLRAALRRSSQLGRAHEEGRLDELVRRHEANVEKARAEARRCWVEQDGVRRPLLHPDLQRISCEAKGDEAVRLCLDSTSLSFASLFPRHKIRYEASFDDSVGILTLSRSAAEKTKRRGRPRNDGGTAEEAPGESVPESSLWPLMGSLSRHAIRPMIRMLADLRGSLESTCLRMGREGALDLGPVRAREVANSVFHDVLREFYHPADETKSDCVDTVAKLIGREILGQRKGANDEDWADLRSRFYEFGFGYQSAAPASSHDGDHRLASTEVTTTPERILREIVAAGNFVVLNSATSTVDNPLGNFCLPHLERHGVRFDPRPEALNDKVRELLYEKESRRTPLRVALPSPGWSTLLLGPLLDRPQGGGAGVVADFHDRHVRDNKGIKGNEGADGGEPFLPSFYELLSDCMDDVCDGRLSRPRLALVLTNSTKDAEECVRLWREFWSMAGGPSNGGAAMVVTAKELKPSVAEEDESPGGDGAEREVDGFLRAFSDHLLSPEEEPRAFLIAAPYGSVAVGANLTIPVPADLPALPPNLRAYLGADKRLRVHPGESEARLDLSDMVLAVAKTNVVAGDEFTVAQAHIVAVNGGMLPLALGGVLGGAGATIQMRLAGKLRNSTFLDRSQWELAKQSIGRFERTLNSSSSPLVVVSRAMAQAISRANDGAEPARFAGPKSANHQRLLEHIRRETSCSNAEAFPMGTASQVFRDFLFQGFPPLKGWTGSRLDGSDREAVRKAYGAFRSVLAKNQVVLACGGKAFEELAVAEKEFNEACGAKPGVRNPPRMEDWFLRLTARQARNCLIPTGNGFRAWCVEGGGMIRLAKDPDLLPQKGAALVEWNFSGSDIAPAKTGNRNRKKWLTLGEAEIEAGNNIHLVVPALMREIVGPALDEERAFDNARRRFGRHVRWPVGDEFELCDVVIDDPARADVVLIDSKSWGFSTMNDDEAGTPDALLDSAEAKIERAHERFDLAGRRPILVFVMRGWWASRVLEKRRCLLYRQKEDGSFVEAGTGEAFDVAIAHAPPESPFDLTAFGMVLGALADARGEEP